MCFGSALWRQSLVCVERKNKNPHPLGGHTRKKKRRKLFAIPSRYCDNSDPQHTTLTQAKTHTGIWHLFILGFVVLQCKHIKHMLVNTKSALPLSKQTQSEIQRKAISMLKTPGHKPCGAAEIGRVASLVIQQFRKTVGQKEKEQSQPHSGTVHPPDTHKERRFWRCRKLYLRVFSLLFL